MPAPTPQPAPTTPYTGLTFLQLQTAVFAWLGLTPTEVSAADLALCKALINEAIANINTNFPGLVTIRKYWSVTTTEDQATYPVPVGLMHIHDPILLDGTPVYSIPTPYENRAAEEDVTAENQNTVRMYSADWGVNDAAMTARPQAILKFHPAPTQGGTMEIWGTGPDNALTADGDLARIPEAYASLPTYYAVQPFLAGKSRSKDLALAEGKWDKGMGQISVLRLRQRTRGETQTIPNPVRQGRGKRFPGTWRRVV